MANTFKDGDGREWSLRITHRDAAPLKALGFDLGDPQSYGELFGFEVMANVLWHLCRTAAAALGIDRDSFDGGLDGPTLDAGRGATLGAAADFTLPPAMAAKRKAELPAVMAAVADRAATATGSTSSGSGGNSPGSADSTPAT